MKLSLGEKRFDPLAKGAKSRRVARLSRLLFLFLFLISRPSSSRTDWLSSLSRSRPKWKMASYRDLCATFLSSGRINYGTPDRESWGRGDPWYLQTARTKIMRSGDTRRASRASYKVLNLSSIVIAFRL